MLFACAHGHKYLVFYAARSVCGKRGAFVGAETVDCLYKTYRAYRNKLVVVAVVGIFFCDMRHKPQVVFDKNLFCLFVAVKAFPDIFLFLFL